MSTLSIAALAGGAILGASSLAPSPLDLSGVQLGMPLEAWKALSFPGPASVHATPICSNDAAARASNLAPTPADRKSGTIVCAYRELFGRFSLPATISLGPNLQIHRLHFAFRQGRLMRIDYQTSVNAFDDITARLSARYGPPAKLTRDTVRTEAGVFPRVRQVWTTSRAQIELIDPIAPFDQMGVELTAKPSATERKAS